MYFLAVVGLDSTGFGEIEIDCIDDGNITLEFVESGTLVFVLVGFFCLKKEVIFLFFGGDFDDGRYD